jgi:hypothetical protein
MDFSRDGKTHVGMKEVKEEQTLPSWRANEKGKKGR